MPSIRTITSAVAVLALAGAGTQATAATPTPHVKAAALQTATDVGEGQVELVFRTDHALPRTSSGSIKATAGVRTSHESSVGTYSAAHHCYFAYVEGATMQVGHQITVHIAIDAQQSTRKVTLSKPTPGAGIGC